MGLTWQLWTSVSEGVSTPGGPVTAMPWEGSYALFISDPGGGIYTIKAVPGYGWEAVPGLTSKPGAPVTAMWSGSRFTLFMADVNGEIFTTSGIPYQGWDPVDQRVGGRQYARRPGYGNAVGGQLRPFHLRSRRRDLHDQSRARLRLGSRAGTNQQARRPGYGNVVGKPLHLVYGRCQR